MSAAAAPRARVLIVDDEPQLRRALARALVRDFEVLTAEDGASALGLLATTRADVVLLDLAMPRMSGAEVLARLREAHPDVEVVLMAAHGELDAAASAARAGAHGFLAKPIDEGPALSTGEITRASGVEPRRVDARIIAATHEDPRELTAAGRLREDLYYRLSAVLINLPPLRQRKEDIPLLAHHFLQKYGKKDGRDVRRISVEAMRALRDHPWPGNVRELESAIEYASVIARGDVIWPADLPPPLAPPDAGPGARRRRRGASGAALPAELGELPYAEAKERAIEAFDRAYVAQLMAGAGGNVSEAARRAGIDRSNFRRLRKKVGAKGGGDGAADEDEPAKA